MMRRPTSFWFFQICILTYSIFFLLTYDPFEFLFCLVLFLTRDVIIVIIISSLNNDLCRRRESELNVALFFLGMDKSMDGIVYMET